VSTPAGTGLPTRVADMRRLLVETADYVRAMPTGLGNTKATGWMTVTVIDDVPQLLGGVRTAHSRRLWHGGVKDARKHMAGSSPRVPSETSQGLTEDQIEPEFPLPMTWKEFYESDPSKEWPIYE
jgi:hypothetical protein